MKHRRRTIRRRLSSILVVVDKLTKSERQWLILMTATKQSELRKQNTEMNRLSKQPFSKQNRLLITKELHVLLLCSDLYSIVCIKSYNDRILIFLLSQIIRTTFSELFWILLSVGSICVVISGAICRKFGQILFVAASFESFSNFTSKFESIDRTLKKQSIAFRSVWFVSVEERLTSTVAWACVGVSSCVIFFFCSCWSGRCYNRVIQLMKKCQWQVN